MTIPAGTLVPRDAKDFGGYELIAKLATGGMAEIFLARSPNAGEGSQVVLKRILPHLAEDEHFVTMFRDEAALAKKLIHPNVCRVYSLGSHAATWYIAMGYLHGVALSRMLSRLAKKSQLTDFRIVAGLIIQACEGLHHAHELRETDGQLLGVVHRDVSPPNIMLVTDGTVKLLDFGIAKARGANTKTRTGTVKGKNAYMSPEQILGKPLDRRSDIFALGAVMFELLAVKRLFHRESDFLTFKAITEEPIPEIRDRRPDIPAALRAALTQSLARDPGGRFPTAKAFAEALRAAVTTLGGPASKAELAAYLAREFADDLSARDALLKAAADPSSAPLSLSASSSGGLPMAPTVPGRPGRDDPTEEIESIDGELDALNVPGPAPAMPSQSMVVGGTPAFGVPGHAGQAPPPVPSRSRPLTAPPFRTPTPPPLFGSHTPTAPTTPTAAAQILPGGYGQPGVELDANLMKGRWRSMARTAVVLAAAGAVAAVLAIFIMRSDEPTPEGSTALAPEARPDAAMPPDANTRPDAANERDQIIAISRYGFFSIDASAKTTIFIDGKPYGATPITKIPLSPGVHKVRAVGPRGKTKKFDVTVFAAQDTDQGTIEW